MGRKLGAKNKPKPPPDLTPTGAVDISGFFTPTAIAAQLGVSIMRVKEILAQEPLIEPVVRVAVYDHAAVAEVRRRVFSG